MPPSATSAAQMLDYCIMHLLYMKQDESTCTLSDSCRRGCVLLKPYSIPQSVVDKWWITCTRHTFKPLLPSLSMRIALLDTFCGSHELGNHELQNLTYSSH
jgi:hypothetical protein